MFTEREQKLIRLAMDKAAHPGERDNCATMLIQSLLKRGINSEQFIKLSGPVANNHHYTHSQGTCPHCGSKDWGAYTFTFGKYRGKTLRQVPNDYLGYCLREMTTSRPELVRAIKHYFKEA